MAETKTHIAALSSSSTSSGHAKKLQKKKANKNKKKLVVSSVVAQTQQEHHKAALASINPSKRFKESASSTDPILPPSFSSPKAELPPSDVFGWLVSPQDTETFFKSFWEKKVLHLNRKQRHFYPSELFSSEILEQIFKKNFVKYGADLEIYDMKDGGFDMVDPGGRAHASVLWTYLEDECFGRLLHPHSYHVPVWRLVGALQEYFGCSVGCDVMVCPAGQSSMPIRFNDFEMFVLQMEGSRTWRLYNHIGLAHQQLIGPLQDEAAGPVVSEITLHQGDLLYLPRGTPYKIYHDEEDQQQSLHISVTTYQHMHWGALLSKSLTMGVEAALREENLFREGLPVDFLSYMGLPYADKKDDDRRSSFVNHFHVLFKKLADHVNVDAACDSLAVDILNKTLPPALSDPEMSLSVLGRTRKNLEETEIMLHSEVRLARRHVARLVVEDEEAIIYHSVENPLLPHSNKAPPSLSFPLNYAGAFELLMAKYPDYVHVSAFPSLDDQEKLELASALFNVGIIIAKT